MPAALYQAQVTGAGVAGQLRPLRVGQSSMRSVPYGAEATIGSSRQVSMTTVSAPCRKPRALLLQGAAAGDRAADTNAGGP
ncbi:hypothetical protein [Streptomyces sp. NPDC058145]|uniref:hypothetical protein n=1 Tax=Streptomyces sp. NPDC058145 TaxID=3346356 RepID=UPI0036E7D604